MILCVFSVLVSDIAFLFACGGGKSSSLLQLTDEFWSLSLTMDFDMLVIFAYG